MSKNVYSLVVFWSLLPGLAVAQANQSGARQLSSEALSVVAPGPEASVAERAIRIYTGRVLDEKGQPLAGALVATGTERSQITVTNADGTYLLRTDAVAPRLRVTYAGYEDAELPLLNAEPVTFNLEPVNDYKRQLRKQGKAATRAFYNK